LADAPILEPAAAGSAGALSGSLLYGYRLNWQSILYAGYGDSAVPAAAAGYERRRELFLKIAYAFQR
jgi:hypothetical protein